MGNYVHNQFEFLNVTFLSTKTVVLNEENAQIY